MKIILMGYLLINAWTDWKRKEIDLVYSLLFMIISVLYKVIEKQIDDWVGLIPGLILIMFSFVWSNHIGIGDGIVVMCFGGLCGLSLTLELLAGGFFLAACGGVICKIKNRKKVAELPFIPFFLGSYILELWSLRG